MCYWNRSTRLRSDQDFRSGSANHPHFWFLESLDPDPDPHFVPDPKFFFPLFSRQKQEKIKPWILIRIYFKPWMRIQIRLKCRRMNSWVRLRRTSGFACRWSWATRSTATRWTSRDPPPRSASPSNIYSSLSLLISTIMQQDVFILPDATPLTSFYVSYFHLKKDLVVVNSNLFKVSQRLFSLRLFWAPKE